MRSLHKMTARRPTQGGLVVRASVCAVMEAPVTEAAAMEAAAMEASAMEAAAIVAVAMAAAM